MTVPASAAGAAAGNQTGGQQQGQQQENQQGANGNDGQGSGQQAGSLLDDEAENGGQQQEQGGQQQGGGDAGQQQNGGLTMDGIARLIDSTFDRRINAVLREVRGTPNGQRQDQQQDGGQQVQQQGQPQQQQPVASGPSQADVREARGVYREYVADEIKFLGNEERDLAANLAQGLLQQRLARGDDAETAGAAVAKEVATTIKNARRLYEDRTVSALKRKGLLPDDAGRPGQPTPGPARPGAQSGYAAGAGIAQQMFASRLPQTQQQ